MMVSILALIAFLASLPILVASLTLSLQLAVAAIVSALPGNVPDDHDALARSVIVVPAHDEEAGLAATLAALKAQSVPGMRILVVADNCTDGTADVARAVGVEVLERTDARRRGKGYALDHAVGFLAQGTAPDVIVFIDADCFPAPGALSLLAGAALARDRPVQACYLMQPAPGAHVRERLRGFAFAVRNRVRPSGGQRLGFPCPLTGSGMAFPWHVIASLPLASGHIVEDLKLGMDSAMAGFPASFCAQARVLSGFPQTQAGVEAQTSRWEHGHFMLMRSYGPRLLLGALRQRRLDLVKLALDLLVPPIGLLLGAAAVLFAAGLALLVLGGSVALLSAALLPIMLLLLALLATWIRHGRDYLAGRELLVIVSHAMTKLTRLRLLLGQREHEWIRSDRSSKDRS